MNKILAHHASISAGGHYQVDENDENWKHLVADQLNQTLGLASGILTEPYSSTLYDLCRRVSEFEGIAFEKRKDSPT